MRFKKKLSQRVSLMMAGILCFSEAFGLISAMAETVQIQEEGMVQVYLAEDFEDYETKLPAGLTFMGDSSISGVIEAEKADQTPRNGVKSLGLKLSEDSQKKEVGIYREFKEEYTGDIIVDVDIKPFISKGTTEILAKGIKGNVGLGNISNGALRVGSHVIPLNENQWNRIAFVLHIEGSEQTADIYVNDEQTPVLTGYQYGKADFTGLKQVRIRSYHKEMPNIVREVYVDNFCIYTGTELKSMEELKELQGGEETPEPIDPLMDFYNDFEPDVSENIAGALAMAAGSRNILFDGQKTVNAINEENEPQKINGVVMVPFRFTARQFGKTVEVDTTAKQVTAEIDGRIVTVTEDGILLDEEMISDCRNVFTKEEVLIPLETVGMVLGKNTYTDKKGRGLILIGDDFVPFNDDNDKLTDEKDPAVLVENEKFKIEEVIKRIVYERPSGEDVVRDLITRKSQHPRLMVTDEDLERIKNYIFVEKDPVMVKWYKDIQAKGEKHLEMPVVTDDIPDGRRMVGSRQVGPLVINLGMLYHLSDDEAKKAEYKNRIWKEVETAAGFGNWNEENEFLNTAEFMEGLALAYDWLYDEWTPEQRELLETAMINKGLIKSLEKYNENVWWIQTYPRPNNWNAVCNGSTIMALLAIGDIERTIELPSGEKPTMQEFAGRTMDIALNALENFILLEFVPDGAWSEGPSYWQYTLEYLVKFMTSLETAVGTGYGYNDTPGFHKTAYFPIYLTGPVGSLNYGDASSGRIAAEEQLWVANQYNDKRLASIYMDNKVKDKDAGTEFDMLWYRDDLYLPNQKADLDQYFSGTEVATFRSKWNDTTASFLGLKAGNNIVSHGHYDLGSFVFEALGRHWAIDLGKDDYNLPGYSNYDKERISYYRLNPQGHNTLVINPDDYDNSEGAQNPWEDYKTQQNIKAFAKIEKAESKERGGFAITNLTDAYNIPDYEADVESARRGVMLSSNRTRATIQDEVTFTNPSEAYWFMHTKADVSVSEDGKTALMSLAGEKLWVDLKVDAVDENGEKVDAVLDVMNAEPLPGTPNPPQRPGKPAQNPNDGIRKLFVKLDNVKAMRLTVTLIPIVSDLEMMDRNVTVKPLDEWSIPDGELEIPVLHSVSVDGKVLEGFHSEVFSYNVAVPMDSTEIPEVTYTYDETLYEVKEVPADDIPGTIKLVVSSKTSPEIISIYNFNFKLLPPEGVDEMLVEIPVSTENVTVSHAQEGNPKEHAFDGDYDTYWGADFEASIQIDFGNPETINSVGIAFVKGNQRSSKFDIETSLDGQVWNKVYSGESSGKSLDIEKAYVRQHEARYVRINGHGNSKNEWNSYAEIRIYQLPKDVSKIKVDTLPVKPGYSQ